MKDQDEIEELFSSAFGDFERIPPMEIKSAIDEQLFNKNAGSTKRRKGFIWISSSLLFLMLVAFFGIQITRSRDTNVLSKNEEATSVKTNLDENDIDAIKSNNQNINKIETANVKQDIKSDLSNINSFEDKGNQKTVNVNSLKANTNDSKIRSSNIGSSKDEHQSVIDNKKRKFNSPKNIEDIELKSIFSESLKNNEIGKIKDETILEQNTVNSKEDAAADLASITPKDTVSSLKTTTAIPADSVSTNLPAQSSPVVPSIAPPLKESSVSPWSISLYSGGTYGTSFLKNTPDRNHKMKEQVGFSSSLEANYSLNSRIGISAGIDMNSRKDIFYKVVPAGDSIIDGITTQYIYLNPVTQDTIIDTLITPNYYVLPSEYNQNQRIQHNSFAIPIYFSLALYSKGNWKMNLNTGLRFSYVQNKMIFNPEGMIEPDFKSFGLRVNIRPEITYSFKKFGIGCYMNLGYDAIPAIELKILNESLQPTFQYFQVKRTRIDYGFGIVLKYHF